MKKRIIFTLAVTLIFAFAFQKTNAQITINIPKIPKIKKPKIEVKEVESKKNNDSAESKQTTHTEETKTSNENSTTAETNVSNDEMDFRLKMFLDDIKKAKKSVDEYDPNTKIYLVGSALSQWLWRAVSMQEREKWGKEWLHKPNEKQMFNEALDALAASAAEKLPNYQMKKKDNAIHNAAEEKMMKGILKDSANYKIYYTGLQETSWLISKNDLGLPTSRYKHGAIWLKDTTKDHPYCYISYVNIIQDYAGGGTYGASYAYFAGDEMVGCPAQ